MMNCWRAKPLLTALLDEELSAADAEAVRKHLDGCAECAELCDRLDAVPPIEAPVLDRGLEARLWDELDRSLDAARTQPAGARPRFREPPLWERVFEAVRSREFALPVPAAMAYAALALLLLGWAAFSHQRVQVLAAQVEAKDETIRVLRSTAALQAREPVQEEQEGSGVMPSVPLPGQAPLRDGLRSVSYGNDPYGADPAADAYRGQAQGYYNLVH